MARNALFQREALDILVARQPRISGSGRPVTLFSYSYAALELFREAKKRGWNTVLGQIDPGPGEDAIVRRLRAEHPEWTDSGTASPPESYWEMWREECSLADRIVVNSSWSRSLLVDAGIDYSKIEVVPLAYEDKDRGKLVASGLPHDDLRNPYSDTHPLKVLWLGQVIVRKGIHDLAAAARSVGEGCCRIDVVGPHSTLPAGLPGNLVFHGPVPRSQASEWYARADVFVLPTHSDGFALTQLEAMAHGLPVIATPCCGDVVVDGVNGWLVPPGTPEALAGLIRRILEEPEVLEKMRVAAIETAAKFRLETVVEALVMTK